jgi:SSS family solute:Na+ symporter
MDLVAFEWLGIFCGHIVMSFPYNMALSLIAAISVSFLTRKQDEASLMNFYAKTNPWGFWNKVKGWVIKQQPSFKPNDSFGIDLLNVLLGIVWQMTLIVMPIYFVIRQYKRAIFLLAICIVISVILKFTWYDRIKKLE